MSRGLGTTQLTILRHLKAAKSGTTLESLRWELWESKGKLPARIPTSDEELPSPLNVSLARATKYGIEPLSSARDQDFLPLPCGCLYRHGLRGALVAHQQQGQIVRQAGAAREFLNR